VERGTWMGHVIEHIALEIQTLVWTQIWRTRETNTWDLQCCFQLYQENVGLPQNQPDCRIQSRELNMTESDLQKMREIRERVRLGPSTGSIVEEAVSRNIPIRLTN
jgi:cyanophycin synthetase